MKNKLFLVGFVLFLSVLFFIKPVDSKTSFSISFSAPIPVDGFPKKFDVYFKKNSKRYFGPGFDWRWFKAQSMAESGLNPEAISPVKAKGLMQIMDFTRRELDRKMKTKGNPFDPRWNIAAGIFYDRQLYNQWKSPRPEIDRLCLMFASYNAGLGNPLKAQKICLRKKTECNTWGSIKSFSDSVNTWKHEETLGYVTKITKFMGHEGF